MLSHVGGFLKLLKPAESTHGGRVVASTAPVDMPVAGHGTISVTRPGGIVPRGGRETGSIGCDVSLLSGTGLGAC
ncbi:hypothetical protein M2156_005817 [Streptomyces sp. SAI-149]|nr:hypothetical protein [Streptomyces sp. SAI-119]MDH6499598.1 hypothetical protein [Streptomyces sp. SAI-149]